MLLFYLLLFTSHYFILPLFSLLSSLFAFSHLAPRAMDLRIRGPEDPRTGRLGDPRTGEARARGPWNRGGSGPGTLEPGAISGALIPPGKRHPGAQETLEPGRTRVPEPRTRGGTRGPADPRTRGGLGGPETIEPGVGLGCPKTLEPGESCGPGDSRTGGTHRPGESTVRGMTGTTRRSVRELTGARGSSVRQLTGVRGPSVRELTGARGP